MAKRCRGRGRVVHSDTFLEFAQKLRKRKSGTMGPIKTPHTLIMNKPFEGNFKFTPKYKIGEGGMGSAFLATTHDGKEVVIKTLEYKPPEKPNSINPEVVANWKKSVKEYDRIYNQRFEGMKEEGRISTELSGSNLVGVWGLIKYKDELPAIVMEKVDGMDLENLLMSYIARGELPSPKQVALWHQRGEQTVYWLSEIYGKAHRDISPNNIMVDKDGKIKFIDCGGAADRFDGILYGKWPYIPPEMINDPEGYDKLKVDDFSLAVTMRKIISGVAPIPAINLEQRMRYELSRIRGLHSICKDVPKYLSEIISLGMNEDPNKRVGPGIMEDLLSGYLFREGEGLSDKGTFAKIAFDRYRELIAKGDEHHPDMRLCKKLFPEGIDPEMKLERTGMYKYLRMLALAKYERAIEEQYCKKHEVNLEDISFLKGTTIANERSLAKEFGEKVPLVRETSFAKTTLRIKDVPRTFEDAYGPNIRHRALRAYYVNGTRQDYAEEIKDMRKLKEKETNPKKNKMYKIQIEKLQEQCQTQCKNILRMGRSQLEAWLTEDTKGDKAEANIVVMGAIEKGLKQYRV